MLRSAGLDLCVVAPASVVRHLPKHGGLRASSGPWGLSQNQKNPISISCYTEILRIQPFNLLDPVFRVSEDIKFMQ